MAKQEKRWLVSDPIDNDFKMRFPELDPVVLQLLWNRGIRTQEDVDVFFGPDWSRDTHDPAQFTAIHDAVARVFQALENEEVITVHGDYDADGVTGSVVLMTTLRDICRKFASKQGFDEEKLTVYIPHREKEGYGFSVETAQHLHEHEQTKLVITVDCGISNADAISHAKSLGIDTIVCDHHAIPQNLPEDAYLIHPQIPGETYPNKHLCGCGVGFKFATMLIREAQKRGVNFPEGYEKWLLDLVAIATVTDVMPLTGENRVIEKYGLHVLHKTRRVGLLKLFEVAGAKPEQANSVALGYQIGPRINAAGRMNHATEAYKLLMAEDPIEAEKMAKRLNETNSWRQKASLQMYEQAKEQIGEVRDRKLIVAVEEDWPAGLVGLVAGKLVGDFQVPVFVVGKKGEKYVGSGRSIEQFDVTEAMQAASECLDKFGGHPQACGFSVEGTEKFEKAVEIMTEFANERLSGIDLRSIINIDAEIEMSSVNWELQGMIENFEPFGQDNPVPKFSSTNLSVISFDTVGKDSRHLRLTVRPPQGKVWKMIGFRLGDWVQKLRLGAIIDVVYEIGVNEWNGNREIQLKLEDLRMVVRADNRQ